MKPALIIVDLQNAYYNEKTAGSIDSAVEEINAALELFRRRSLPIVWVRHSDAAENCLPGSEGFEFIPSLSPLEGEPRVVKTYRNSFNRTGLAELLSGCGTDTAVICGFRAEYCILATIVGAMDNDIMPILLESGVAGGDSENLDFVMRINMTINLKRLDEILC